MDQPKLALDRWSGAYTYERALYPHRHYADEPQTRSNSDNGCRPAVACLAYVVGEAACHPNVARCFCNSGISVGPPVRAADRRVRTAWQICCLLLTQSGHLVLGLLPSKNDGWTPLSNSRTDVRALLYRPPRAAHSGAL